MTLIYGLYLDGQYHEAGKFFSGMRESGMVPDSFTYSLLIRGQCMLGYVLNAMMLYADMVKIGVKPTRYATVCPEIWSKGFTKWSQNSNVRVQQFHTSSAHRF
jgi:pentatricopeptide repeat protein